MEKVNEATCENCGGLFMTTIKRYYCSHCDEYFHVCPSCRDSIPKCRFCGITLRRKSEPLRLRTLSKSIAR